MFDELKRLVSSLSDGGFENWRNSSETRKRLQSIKKECDKLRKAVLEKCKESNPKLYKS